MRIKSPCDPNCPRRVLGCRPSCKEWQEYEVKRFAEYERREKLRLGAYTRYDRQRVNEKFRSNKNMCGESTISA